MNFTEEDIKDIKELAAEKLADRAEANLEEAYGVKLSDLIQLPVSLVSRTCGLNEKTVRSNFPVIEYGERQGRIAVGDMIKTINNRKK